MLRLSYGVVEKCFLLWLLVSLIASFAAGQSETATLSGQVVDPSGLNITGAQVKLVDIDRDTSTSVTTNNTGLYTFPSVRPGRYRMEVIAAGFKVVNVTGITVNVQDHLEQNFKLVVGSVSESITVEGGAPLVDTESATVSTVVDRQFVENIPLNGRSFQTLIALTPGVVVTSTNLTEQGQFSVNGQRADANYFTVDGVSANAGVNASTAGLYQFAGGALPGLSALGGTNSLVSVDAMQEFRIQTSSFAPEFGRSPGGQISIVTRSGNNSLHGTLFDYLRNDVLDASNWFADFYKLPKPKERQNDFGGTLSGPIRKDRTFFFFSYEGLRMHQPLTLETVVPDATSRQQAPTAIQPFLNAFPVANGPEQGGGLAQFDVSYSNPAMLDAYSIRVDHTINSKLNLFGRYNYAPSDTAQRGPFSPASVLSTIEMDSFSTQTLTLGLTESVSQFISNEVRANYSNMRVESKYGMDSFGGAVPLSDTLLFPSGLSSANSLFQLFINGAGEIAVGRNTTNEQRQFNVVDNLSVTAGSHQLKFGVDYRWLAPFASPFSYDQFAFFLGVTGTFGALSGTPLECVVGADQRVALLSRNFSLYAQDAWKATPRLMLTYGLRWDINPPLKGKNASSQPFTVNGLNDPATMTLAPRGTPLYNTSYAGIAPRLGVAYQLKQGQNFGAIIRGGFGLFYDLGSGSLGGVSSFFPFTATNTLTGVPFPLTPQQAAPPALTVNPPVSLIYLAERNLRLPWTYEWNIAFEQSLGASQVASVTYIGAAGRDLLRQSSLSSPNADFPGQVVVAGNSGTSDYEAIQLKFQRRLSRRLQGLASYTFSHSIDNVSNDSSFFNTPAAIANPSVDRGNSDFDVRHSFTSAVTYDLPVPTSQKILGAVFGSWSVDDFVMWRSAPAVDLIGAYAFAGGAEFAARPNIVAGQPFYLYGSQYPGGRAINPAAFIAAPTGQQGNLGRNVLRGFGAWQTDLALRRQFHFRERLSLQFRAEAFNIFNHPNFGPPVNTLGFPSFGQSTTILANSLGTGGTGGGFNPLYQIGGPRSIQLALKLQF